MPSPLLLPVGNVVLLFWTVPGLAKLEGAVSLFLRSRNFYLRPPHGGQPQQYPRPNGRWISIHALRMEGDLIQHCFIIIMFISIHALRMEGDDDVDQWSREHPLFPPMPSARRGTEI